MTDIILPEEMSSVAKLSNILKDVVRGFTQHEPMNIEDIVEAMAFTTGYAIGNRPDDDQKRWDTKALRLMAVGRLDKGIDTARNNRGQSSIIMPSANLNRIAPVKS